MGLWQAIKCATGIQAYQDNKKEKSIRSKMESLIASEERRNDMAERTTQDKINKLGAHKLNACETVCKRFLEYVETAGKSVNDKELDFLSSVQVDLGEIEQMKELTMNASELAKNTAKAGVLAAVTCAGVPSLVTGAVSALATASTGTAISTLSGAAATNATLAWLGGGSLAAGGGGVAAGAAALSAMTWAATGGVALIAGGLIASRHYSKKLTETESQYAEVQKWAADCSLNRKKLNGVCSRCDELDDVLTMTEERGSELLDLIEPLIYDFEFKNMYYEKLLQQTSLVVKSVSTQTQTPLLDNGNPSSASELIIQETRKMLVSEL